ncbi:transposable element Tcb1 transposase [Trichonephila clavipes]|nr:transposable element Tcb1 transposase [Trichonephila clavipes]
MDYVQGCLYTGFPSRQTIDVCVCNGLMSTKLSKLIEASFLDESRFTLWDHDGCIRLRLCTGERCLAECVMERHSVHKGLGVRFRIMDDPICYELRQDNALPYAAKTVRDFCLAQRMQLLPWLAYSRGMLPIEHVWDLVGRRTARDQCPAASKDELLLGIQASVISLLKEDKTDQAIEEPYEIMHINRDSESKYDKSDRHEMFELNFNFQMLPKELYQEN